MYTRENLHTYTQMLLKAIIACTPSASAAQGVGMGVVSLSFCFSGFLVTRASIPDYVSARVCIYTWSQFIHNLDTSARTYLMFLNSVKSPSPVQKPMGPSCSHIHVVASALDLCPNVDVNAVCSSFGSIGCFPTAGSSASLQ
jgi:hypothetical protein